ncbi:hypothetical protein BC827DRAFT_1158100 [Russula dissimulans]|nr:hypothetical protein BC827DRAFT_1158100 [Russula dissimulans]
MASGPSVSSETRERQREVRNALTKDIEEVLEVFVNRLDNVAAKHGRSTAYVQSLAGIGGVKKVTKAATTAYAAFCGKKLEQENEGKEQGSKTTLPAMLKKCSDELSAEFSMLSKSEKMRFLPIVSKPRRRRVLQNVYQMLLLCQDLNQQYQTESLVLFCHSTVAHSYSSGSFATEGARRWLENAEIGNNTPQDSAIQLEGFCTSNCGERIRKIKEGSARLMHRKIREAILKAKKHPCTVQMNYTHYEDKIVESLGVALVGWPINGPVQNPGELTRDDAIILKHALETKDCKWIRLTTQQIATRKARNKQCLADGEQVYGPPRKQRARKIGPSCEGLEIEGGGEMDEDENVLEVIGGI